MTDLQSLDGEYSLVRRGQPIGERARSDWLSSLLPRFLSVVRRRAEVQNPAWLTSQSLHPAVHWLMYAHSVGNDGGLSAFYDLLRDSWAPSYPETTGYTIPSLFAYARHYSDEPVRCAALEMAEYLLEVQTAEGPVRGWHPHSPAFVFDTGQVLFGWLAAFKETKDLRFQSALLHAADWLLANQEPGGYWSRHQFGGHVKVWDVRVAWPLLLVGQILDQPEYIEAGLRCMEWALAQQESDGWFQHSSLEPGQPPVTHTIAYTIEALLEAGVLLTHERYYRAGRLAADALLNAQRSDGGLSATWAPRWQPLSRSSCLTGNAQMALCWLRLCEHTGEEHYREAAGRALTFLASTQRLDGHWGPIRGAIAGSWPIWGHYLPWRFPNWAAKFYLDALMMYRELADEELGSESKHPNAVTGARSAEHEGS